MCESQKGQASKGKSNAGSKIRDKIDAEGSSDLQLEGEVALGDLIWVKLRGDSWWPALVVDENGVSESSKPGNRSKGEVLVRLYGSYEYLYVNPMTYFSEFKMVLERNNGSFHEIFSKALEQDYSPRKSVKRIRQGSKSTGPATKRADASKGKTKSKKDQVKGNQMHVNDGEALSKSAKHHGVKRKRGSNEPNTEEVINNKKKKLRSDSKTSAANKKTSKLDTGKKKTTSSQGKEQKKVKPNGRVSDGTQCITPKQDKMLKGKTNSRSAERASPGKSPESSARRMRVMQGLGLIAPSGSPFHKNGLI